jgi:hypothetical protein
MATAFPAFGLTLGSFAFNVTTDDGVAIIAEAVSGFGSPASSVQFVPRSGARGSTIGEAFTNHRPITIKGVVIAPSDALMESTRDALTAAVSADETPLVRTIAGAERTMQVVKYGEVIVEYVGSGSHAFRYSILLAAPDPRMLGPVQTGSTGLRSSTGGFTAPFTAPFTVDSTIVSGQVALTSEGNVDGPVRLRITAGSGGLTAPVVTHVSSGKSLVFGLSLTLAQGSWADVDMDARTVLENGTAYRNGWVVSRGWSAFQPGGNVWSFAAASGNGTLEVFAYDAWE